MNDKQTGGPAFPGFHPPPGCRYQEEGMTLRDYFAAKAMQSLILDQHYQAEGEDKGWSEFAGILADEAYEIADSMLKARDGQP